jgi:prepilin signal peptidase PulO-like enzyme (type II secretory pathway)
MIMAIAFIAVFGLIIGSFLNAVLWRMKVGKSVLRGRSMCPRCKKTLGARDLIPLLSYLWLRGRCRYCQRSISAWYPAIEAGTALLYVLSFLEFGLGATFTVDLVVFPFLILIFAYDSRESLILDRVSLPGAALAFLGSLWLGLSFWNVLGSAILGAGFFGLQYLLSSGRWVGGGDIRLGLLMGSFLGWPSILFALCLAYVGGSIIGVGLIVSKRKTWQSAIPFGTFLTIATVLFHLYGHRVLPYLT